MMQTALLGPRRCSEKEDDWPCYWNPASGLLWISGMTQPDITSAVRAASRHGHIPGARHRKGVCKILASLKATKDLGLHSGGNRT